MTTLRDLEGVNPTPTEALLPKRRIVTVIGIDHYREWPTLDNAVSDAVGVQKLLIERYGFEAPIEPRLEVAATKPAIESLVLDELRSIVNEDDALVVFFAGHGHTRTDRVGSTTVEKGYLVPVEARRGDHFGDLLDVDSFLEAIGRLAARHVLVFLDACNSGMALSTSVKLRSPASFSSDLANKVSRRVITSARARQPAQDGGPIPGHSLFTGTLIDGLTWGKADLDGNGVITSSELGLYLQQQVGNASTSRQTPDFGAFHFDDRGEMLIPLGEDDFAGVKARAYSALQAGERRRFEELVDRAIALRPDSPDTAYLEYRRALAAGDLAAARERLNRLTTTTRGEWLLPLAHHEVRDLSVISQWWWEVFSIEPRGIPIEARVLAGPSEDQVRPVVIGRLGDLEGYTVQENDVFALEIVNPTQVPQHVYCVHVGATGNITFLPLWSDLHCELDGLAPGTTTRSLPFRVRGTLGLEELWVFASERMIHALARPPSVMTRAATAPLTAEHAKDVSLQKLYLSTRARSRSKSDT